MKPSKPSNRKRGTRERILRAAIKEFSRQGYRGGRVERIVRDAGVNLRMIYHYFGGKEDLYIASLERVYLVMRNAEQALNLSSQPPLQAMRLLIDFAFQHLASHPDFIGLVMSENQLGARYLRRSRLVPSLTQPMLAVLKDVLDRGQKQGVFRSDVDPMQFFLTLHALCYLHIANKSTLSVIFHRDLSDPAWLAARGEHVQQVLSGYLAPPTRRSAQRPTNTARRTPRRANTSPRAVTTGI